jgi:hypothetical protein
MSLKNHLTTLLWKNWLLWKRNIGISLCEILFPVVLFLFILLLRAVTPSEDEDAESYAVPNNLGRGDGQVIVPSVDAKIFELLSVTFLQLYNSRVDSKFTATDPDFQLRSTLTAPIIPFSEFYDVMKDYEWNIGYVPELSKSELAAHLEEMIPLYFMAQEYAD